VTGNLKGKKIAPLLLVQFIENAFKHGASMSLGKVRIDIEARIEEESLFFSVDNTKPQNQNLPSNEKKGGIGLSNVEKRLKLRYGEDEYRLDINDLADRYIVNLMLKLR